jgi:hypothetical protein
LPRLTLYHRRMMTPMPTYEMEASFLSDLRRLSRAERRLFREAVDKMVEDLKAKRPFRAGLRVKRFRRIPGAYELAWANDGRALFTYGTSPHPGDTHIVSLRVGTHDIFANP